MLEFWLGIGLFFICFHSSFFRVYIWLGIGLFFIFFHSSFFRVYRVKL